MRHWPPDSASVPTFNGSLLGKSVEDDISLSDSDSGSDDDFDFGPN